MKLINEFFRWHALITGWPIYMTVFKTRFYYEDEDAKENKRIKGGALIVSNHFSGLDYMITLFKYFGRKVYVIMLEDVFKMSGFLRWSIDIIGGIRADRDIQRMRFMDEGINVLKRGKLLQIYPEAHNTPNGQIQQFKPSYILIALRAGVPIVPLVVDGQYNIKTRAHALIGKSIRLTDYCSTPDPSREEIERLNAVVYGKIVSLKEELDRRKSLERKKGK